MKNDILNVYNNKSILITGGNGFIASSLIQQLSKVDCTIRCLIRDGQKVNYPNQKNLEYREGDVKNEAIWPELVDNVDYIFHFAAQTSTYTSNSDPTGDVRVNVYPMIFLLEACRKKNIKPVIIFSSTATVSGINQKIPVTVHIQDKPVTIYDIHKLTAEKYLLSYIANDFVRGTILRLANVYGPGPTSSAKDRGILNIMIKKAYKGEELTIYGTGEFIRDYVYIDDAARAFLYAGGSVQKTNGKYYLIGSGVGYSIVQAAQVIQRVILQKKHVPVSIKHVDPPEHLSPIEKRNFIADISEFTHDTGWSPSVSLETGIDHTIESVQ